MVKQEMVYPGSFLSFEEEFVPNMNAFDSDGQVFSDSIGFKNLDEQSHEANVSKVARDTSAITRGSFVIGRIAMLKSSVIFVEIFEAERNDEKLLVNNKDGLMFVRNLDNKFVEHAEDLYRVGDIIKAKVLDAHSYGIEIETKSSPNLGVIKAFGVRSRKPLVLVNEQLRDPATGSTEMRKISSDYLLR